MSGVIVPKHSSVYPGVPEAKKSKATDAAKAYHFPSRRGRVKHGIIAGIGSLAVAALLVGGFQLGFTKFYSGKMLPGVTVAGQSIGGLTKTEAKQRLATVASAKRVSFTLVEQSYVVKPIDIGAAYTLDTTVEAAYRVGRGQWFAPLQLLQAHRATSNALTYTLNKPVLESYVSQLVSATGQPAVDATVTVQNGIAVVQPDKNGVAIDAVKLRQVIMSQIDGGQGGAMLKPVAQPAHITAAATAPAVKQVSTIVATPVAITASGKTVSPTAAQIGSWVVFDKTATGQPAGYVARVDTAAVKAYVASLASSVDVKPVLHKVNVQDGAQQEVQAGMNGSAIDQDALVAAITAGVAAHTPVAAEAVMRPVAFQTQYNNSVSLPFAKYIEINLTTQHMWAYQDHNVAYDSPVTSGATGAGFPTITGQFAIQAKQRDRYLNGQSLGPGYNYNVFVHYWMPFSGNYGMHDASWRNGSFGGQDYYRGGSHGCVNLPDATAAWVYNWGEVGTPVWVHT